MNMPTENSGLDAAGVVLLSSLDESSCQRVRACLGGKTCTVVRDLAALSSARGHSLLSFGTSVIVPSELLKLFQGRAYNIHEASPDFPGRDPHHWATYASVLRYGATLHFMTELVDDGPIIDVEWFDVNPGTTPSQLLSLANEAAFKLVEQYGPRIQRCENFNPTPSLQWSGKKSSRSDFQKMCRIEPDISQEEFDRRFRAFQVEGYDNLTVELYGQVFRIDNKGTS